MSDHTPAPWFAIEEPHTASVCEQDPELRYFHLYGPERHLDCKLHLSGFLRPADAHLIAAAPGLLAMVRRYASECANCGGSGDAPYDDAYPCSECEDIWALIDKAARA
ncbi:MAG TPA: hypothetical protein VK524_20320 [Polyangiaceae bacterium]|nr:hypothetical protein [Polyangiaceae bacterium]